MAHELSARELIFLDLDRELGVTRKVLERLPEKEFEWRPHEKSMTLGQLGTHVSDMPAWLDATLRADELDGADTPKPPAGPLTSAALLARFDGHVAKLRETVAKFDPAAFNRMWTMKNGGHVITSKERSVVWRVWSMNHMVHHRGQLCLYLRLLNVPVPTVYFNTADDPTWVFE